MAAMMGVDMKKIEKAVVLQKPKGCDDGLEVQEKLFDIITARFVWLCLRVEINEQGLLTDQRKRWCERVPYVFEMFLEHDRESICGMY
jgi:hypothetical protein